MPDTQFPEQKQLYGCFRVVVIPKAESVYTARQKHTHFYTDKQDQIYNATLRRSVCTVSNSDVTAVLPIGTLSLRYVMELYTVLRAEV